MPTIRPGSKDTAKNVEAENIKGKTDSKASTKDADPKEKSSDGTPERRTSTAGAERMGNLRNKFESGAVNDKKKKKKSAPKIKYAGAESAKNKFIETANKNSNGLSDGPRGPKAITPPPEGVAVGVLESKPQPRAPDVVTADDSLDPVDLTVIGDTTKNLREKFKQLESSGGQLLREETIKSNAFEEEFRAVGPEASRTARARWKDIESGKAQPDTAEEKRQIDIRDGYGGVYENQPEQLENIMRGGQTEKEFLSGLNARERREEFLRKANESSVVKKEPTKLLDINASESGIYENEPARREDVIRYDDEQNDDYPPTSAKWASEAKSRFMQEANKAAGTAQRTHPVTVVEGEDSEEGSKHQFATEAKQAFFERQKQAEEAEKNRSRPQVIDIWGEQCADSGIFENKPAARSANVVRGRLSDDEESEESDDEEDEEEE